MTRVDLDAAERIINRPHVIELRTDGWTIMHPPACHPRLFACPVNRATEGMDDPGLRGQYECALNGDDEFAIGEPIEDAPGIDWAVLVAELRAARAVVEAARYVDADAPDPWRKFSAAMDGLRSTLRKYERVGAP
jgi:hypothetical protein